jgi:hypothetical protein
MNSLHGQILGFDLFALEEQVANPGQAAGCAVMGVVVRLAGPHGAFVELNPLVGDGAEDHRAQTTVTNRERLDPLPGGLSVPELLGVRAQSQQDQHVHSSHRCDVRRITEAAL